MDLAARDRHDEAGDLVFAEGLEHPALGFAIAPAQRVGHAPELLDDRCLSEMGKSEAAAFLGNIHQRQPHGDAGVFMRLSRRLGYAALVDFGLQLERP